MDINPELKSKGKELRPLYTFSHGGVTGAVILDDRRKKENDLYPIRYRVIFDRKANYYKSGYDASIDEWKLLPESGKRNLKEKRELIKSGIDIIENHVKEIKNDFSFDALNRRMGKGKANDINTTFQNKINKLFASGKVGTSDWYKYSLQSINLFAKTELKPTGTEKDLKFTDITIDFLKKYELWLLNEDKENKKKAKSFTTISMYMRALQSIVNEGIRAGYLPESKYPFGKDKYEIPIEEGRNLALTIAQIGEVLKYQPLTENELRSRDLWYFSYLCNGINFVDLLKLKFSDISNGEISFYRQKTINKVKKKKKISAPLLPQMQEIIDKWGNKNKLPDTYIFPFMKQGSTPTEEQRIVKNITHLVNDHMTKIGKALNMGNITTYTSRHSFATVLKRSGANISYISESLGHTDIDITAAYLDTFEKDERLKNSNLLIPNPEK